MPPSDGLGNTMPDVLRSPGEPWRVRRYTSAIQPYASSAFASCPATARTTRTITSVQTKLTQPMQPPQRFISTVVGNTRAHHAQVPATGSPSCTTVRCAAAGKQHAQAAQSGTTVLQNHPVQGTIPAMVTTRVMVQRSATTPGVHPVEASVGKAKVCSAKACSERPQLAPRLGKRRKTGCDTKPVDVAAAVSTGRTCDGSSGEKRVPAPLALLLNLASATLADPGCSTTTAACPSWATGSISLQSPCASTGAASDVAIDAHIDDLQVPFGEKKCNCLSEDLKDSHMDGCDIGLEASERLAEAFAKLSTTAGSSNGDLEGTSTPPSTGGSAEIAVGSSTSSSRLEVTHQTSEPLPRTASSWQPPMIRASQTGPAAQRSATPGRMRTEKSSRLEADLLGCKAELEQLQEWQRQTSAHIPGDGAAMACSGMSTDAPDVPTVDEHTADEALAMGGKARRLGLRLEELIADALQCSCDRNVPGAMDVFEQATSSIEVLAVILQKQSLGSSGSRSSSKQGPSCPADPPATSVYRPTASPRRMEHVGGCWEGLTQWGR